MKATENNFISLLRKRKEEGILYVIETYGALLQSVVRKRLSAFPDKTEECMNDIFLGIWQNIDSFDESKGTFANWACGVARLESIDTLRKMQRERDTVSLSDIELSQEDSELLHIIERELSEETETILNCLSPKDQELFRRIYIEEETPESTGRSLGISRENVYVRLFRAKQLIRRNFKNRNTETT